VVVTKELVQPAAFPHMIPVDQAEGGAGDENNAGDIDCCIGAKAFVQALACQGNNHECDGHVDPEDPLPGQSLRDGSANDRAEDEGKAGQAAEQSQRFAAFLRWERRAQQSHRQRHDQRCASPLQGARNDQPRCIRCQRAGDRGGDEQHEPDHKHPPSPQAIAQRRPGQQQDRKAEVIGIEDPFERLDRGAKVGPDCAERSHDHDGVEDHHEGRRRCQDQRPGFSSRTDFAARHIDPPLRARPRGPRAGV
jgi:hypothetical protein